MQYIGQILLFGSFVISSVTFATSLSNVISPRHDPDTLKNGVLAKAYISAAIASLFLYSILSHDFSNMYIYGYTSTKMSKVYLITAFWAGEKGALLFWSVVLSFMIGGFCYLNKVSHVFLTVSVAAVLFFDIILIFASNPFEVFIFSPPPIEGSGMNPLLQNPLMALHPPLQLAGFVSYTIPYAQAISGIILGERRWVEEARRPNLCAWTLLTAGLVIGELWAYIELGWGGYWGWDPVENAALLPWLSGTALLHTMRIETRMGLFRRWNFFLISLTFLLTIFATFLTRSQLISSLHAFSSSVLAPYFLYYMLAIILLSSTILVWKWKELQPNEKINSLWSRESLIFLASIFFLMTIFIVIWGTLLPKLTESEYSRNLFNHIFSLAKSVTGEEWVPISTRLDIGPEWFAMVSPPFGIAILFCMAVGTLLPIRSAKKRSVFVPLIFSLVLSLICALIIYALLFSQSNSLYTLFALWFALFAFYTIVIDIVKSIKARKSVVLHNALSVWKSLIKDNPPRYVGHFVHLGVALSFIGFAGSAMKIEKKDVLLEYMEGIDVGGSRFIFIGIEERYNEEEDYVEIISNLLWFNGQQSEVELIEKVGYIENAHIRIDIPPEIMLDLGQSQDLFYIKAWAEIDRGIYPIMVDKENLTFFLVPKDMDVIRVKPRSFHRLIDEAKRFQRAVGADRVDVEMEKGEPMMKMVWKDKAGFEAMEKGFLNMGKGNFWAVRLSNNKISVIPKDVGILLKPSIRYYSHFESPTSEVSIYPRLFEDIYAGATPSETENKSLVTVIINPLMWGVWIGAILLVGGGAIAGYLKTRRSYRC